MWFEGQRGDDLHLTSTVIAELAQGIERLPIGRRRSGLTPWLWHAQRAGLVVHGIDARRVKAQLALQPVTDPLPDQRTAFRLPSRLPSIHQSRSPSLPAKRRARRCPHPIRQSPAGASDMRVRDYVWPLIGATAVIVSTWLLYHEIRNLSLDDIVDSLNAIPLHRWLLAASATIVAYVALAGYDRIALSHLGKRISWPFVTLCSFTTYALAHNIGASVFSGAVVRYRAYTSRGLTATEVGILVALCSFTFALGTLELSGLVLLIEPELAARFVEDVPEDLVMGLGAAMLALISLYVLGSWMRLKPFRIGSFQLSYPRLPIVLRQLVIGPLELIGAAGIIYFALPGEGNPGFLVVLGIFLASFTAALLSHAPGGLGVLEIMFVTGLPDSDPADVLAALIVFRLFYLLTPFAVSLLLILLFERGEFVRRKLYLDRSGPSSTGGRRSG
jgi:glycosyltransferase 2 family protein